MDFTLRRDKAYSSYLDALKSTAKRSGRRPPSFPTPPHFSYLNSLPEYRLPNIPPDLVTEILSHLPIQSLLRFRCVCKPWRDSISDPRLALSFQNRKIAIRYGKGLYDLNLHSESDKVTMVELQYPMRKKEICGTEEVEMPRFQILENGKVLVAVDGKQILVYNPSEDSRRDITSPTNIFAYEESLVSPDSCGGGNDWRIERVDAWNYVYCDDSDYDSDRGRQKYDWCPCCAYDPSHWDDMCEVDCDYDWEEEDFFIKEKQRHRMRIRTKNL
ncbi:hypothetical protein RHMOL_Rhmol04G0340700 [Rhododendron molle]|uniref:Uncharacterized protein n=1 Tax=Rhododendron molle TaxID=49168 RepID=A0ACC0P8H1_RHOML|nr:hypothetical protein RHMOL_Rhmol04G0340700 [Rhododendron molle]